MGFKQLLKNTWKKGDPLWSMWNHRNANFYANFVNDLQGVGCRVQQPRPDGLGARIIVGDGGSDVDTTELEPDFTPPDYKPIKDVENQLSDRGVNKTFAVQSDSASFDQVLDDTEDYRRRHIECWIDQTSAGDNTSPTVGEEWLNCPSADVNIVSDSPYTVYVSSTDGSLNVSATASTTEQVVIWVRASDNVLSPCTCPCTTWYPSEWPCEDLVETYEADNNMLSPFDNAEIYFRVEVYSNADCTGSLLSWAEYRLVTCTMTAEGSPACSWEGTKSGGFFTRQARNNSNTTWQNNTNMGDCTLGRSIATDNWFWGGAYTSATTKTLAPKATGATPVGEYVYDDCIGGGVKHIINAIVTEST